MEAAAQPWLFTLAMEMWLCIPCLAGGMVGLCFGSSPGDPAGVPGDTTWWQPLELCDFSPGCSGTSSTLGESGSSCTPRASPAQLFQGLCLPAHPKAWHPLESSWADLQGASFFRKMPFDSFVSAGASSSVRHELCTVPITPMSTALKTMQGLRKDLLPQLMAPVWGPITPFYRGPVSAGAGNITL